MLRYSQEGLEARPDFYASYADITIIVEDVGKENFYGEVMRRLLQGQPKTARVLGVGGKSQVLKRISERDETQQGRREFYLVDGDFDELLGVEFSDIVCSYRLRRYDIESYLVEELAVCTIASEEKPSIDADQFQDSLELSDWISDVVDASIRLVACAALIHELGESKTGIPTNIERYTNGAKELPDRSLIDKQIGLVRNSLSAEEAKKFDARLNAMVDRMGSSFDERVRWVSGKDVLIPLLIRLLRQHVKRNLEKDSLCFRLAKNCTFEDLRELRDRILSVA